jgi:hypothetical protein
MRISRRDIITAARKDLGISCRSDRNFRSNFVFAPKVIAHAWNELTRKRLLPANAKVKHLLWFLLWCKIYYTYDQAEGPCRCNRDTFEKWVMAMGKALQRLHTVSGCRKPMQTNLSLCYDIQIEKTDSLSLLCLCLACVPFVWRQPADPLEKSMAIPACSSRPSTAHKC